MLLRIPLNVLKTHTPLASYGRMAGLKLLRVNTGQRSSTQSAQQGLVSKQAQHTRSSERMLHRSRSQDRMSGCRGVGAGCCSLPWEHSAGSSSSTLSRLDCGGEEATSSSKVRGCAQGCSSYLEWSLQQACLATSKCQCRVQLQLRPLRLLGWHAKAMNPGAAQGGAVHGDRGGGLRRCSRREAKPDWDVRDRVVIGALPLRLRVRAGSSAPSTNVSSWACARHRIPQPMRCSSGVGVVHSGQRCHQAGNQLHHLHGCGLMLHGSPPKPDRADLQKALQLPALRVEVAPGA